MLIMRFVPNTSMSSASGFAMAERSAEADEAVAVVAEVVPVVAAAASAERMTTKSPVLMFKLDGAGDPRREPARDAPLLLPTAAPRPQPGLIAPERE